MDIDEAPPRLPFIMRLADLHINLRTRVKRGTRVEDQLRVFENLPKEDLDVLERIIHDESARRALAELVMVKTLLPFWGAMGFGLGLALGGLIPLCFG